MQHTTDTIAAIATPPGHGGIAIVRISGANALSVLLKVFQPFRASRRFPQPRYMHYGYALASDGQQLDDVLAVFMPAPHSATGEDIVELQCHGGAGVTACILDAVMSAGCRLAAPGEFTRRAFLNGKMDLTQAEAVAELIHAPTRQAVQLAKAKLDGVFGKKISDIRRALDALRIQCTLAIDFSEDEAELLSPGVFHATLTTAQSDIQSLLDAYSRARLWREGASVVLVGAVNAGKSSLFNALFGKKRAIVSDIAGTTRDYIEESLHVGGLALRLIDTAGLRIGEDSIEQEGINRSHSLARDADLIVFVIDATKGLSTGEHEFLHQYADEVSSGKVLFVINKIDLASELCFDLPGSSFYVSAETGDGLTELTLGIQQRIIAQGGALSDESVLAPNLRQAQLLEGAVKELSEAMNDFSLHIPIELLASRLEYIVHMLDDVIGTTSTESLLDTIFHSFCIGK